MRRNILMSIVVMSLLFTSCSMLQQVIQKPAVTYDHLELKDLSFTDATCVFHLNVTNPNPIGFSSQKITYQLDLNQSPFFSGTFEQGLSVPAQGSAPLAIPVSINFFDFFKSVQAFKDAESIPYKFNGSIAIGPFDVPFQTSGEIPVPQLPKIFLKKVKVEKLGLLGASVVFFLGIQNSNDFAIDPKGLNYHIGLNGIDFADGAASEVNAFASGESTLQVPLELNFVQLGKAAYQVLKGGETSYSLKGDWLLGTGEAESHQIPFEKTGVVPLSF